MLYMKKQSLALLILLAGILSASATKQPNILFIAVDDLKPMLGCYGTKDIKSPNIDRLADRGMVFLNNSCQQSVCGPSRASLMTGCYPDTTKIYDLKTKMRNKNPDILTIPQYFKQNGYETTGTGKIYDGRCVDSKMDEPSWSIPFVNADAYYNPNYPPPVLNYYQSKNARKLFDQAAEEGVKGYNKIKKYLGEHGEFKTTECADVPDDAYEDGAVANSAIRLLKQLKEGKKPFFLGVGFKKPHLPFVAPKKYWDMYDPKHFSEAAFQKMPKGAPEYAFQDSWELRSCYPNIPAGILPEEDQIRMIHGYHACVSYVDAQIGKVLKALKDLGLAENTIVVLWGDHGWHLGDHGMWCKHTNYEQAVRAPLIFSYPRMKNRGVKTDSPTEFVDIFPTLCTLAGLPIPEGPEGKSLQPLFDDPSASVHKAGLEQFPRGNDKMGYTLRNKRYRYIKWVKMDYYGGERTGPTVATELYDYEKDPLETVNLANNPEYKDVVAHFERIFKERGIAQEKSK